MDESDYEPRPISKADYPVYWKWLKSTDDLQRNTYGYRYQWLNVNFPAVADAYAAEQCRYLDWNVTAAVQELAELREEFHWKPWATDKPFVNRERILKEAVDVLHFIGNILVGIGVTDEELEEHYKAKQEINRRRAASGNYSAKKGGLAHGSD